MIGTRITLIEDNARILSALSLALSREGYEVRAYQHTDDCKTLDTDVLVLDFLLAESTAIEFLEKLAKDRTCAPVIHRIPIIIISAYPSSKLELDNTGFNIVGFLPKPFDLKDLFELIQKAVPVSSM